MAHLPIATRKRHAAAYKFDGSANLLSTTGDFTDNAATTISAWIKVNDTAQRKIIASVADSSTTYYYSFEVSAAEVLYFQKFTAGGSGSVTGSTTITAGVWTHVAIRRDTSDNISFYVNGVEENLATVNIDSTNEDTLTIGVSADSTPFGYFDGSISDVTFWHADIGKAAIQHIARGVSPLRFSPEKIWGYWPLDGTYKDYSKAGNDLTTTSAPSLDAAPNKGLFYDEKVQFVDITAGAPPVGGTGKSNPLFGPLGGPLAGPIGL